MRKRSSRRRLGPASAAVRRPARPERRPRTRPATRRPATSSRYESGSRSGTLAVGSARAGEAETALRDDAALDLARAAVDRRHGRVAKRVLDETVQYGVGLRSSEQTVLTDEVEQIGCCLCERLG